MLKLTKDVSADSGTIGSGQQGQPEQEQRQAGQRQAGQRRGWRWAGLSVMGSAMLLGILTQRALALPNGTWLSKPQIWFHLSTNTLDQAMLRIRQQGYRLVFLDFRNVSDQEQRRVADQVRRQHMIPVAWIQSPQYRSLSVAQLAAEGQHADGIQLDDHFFSHYSRQDFYQLRSQYPKRIYCSIQPFQASVVPPTGCNELDVQCYAPESFQQCRALADRLKAVTSLSATNTLGFKGQMNGRAFNVFLWPHSDEFLAQPAFNSTYPSTRPGYRPGYRNAVDETVTPVKSYR